MTELATDLARPRGRYGVDGNYGLIRHRLFSPAICCCALPQRFWPACG